MPVSLLPVSPLSTFSRLLLSSSIHLKVLQVIWCSLVCEYVLDLQYKCSAHCPLLTTGRWKNERAGSSHVRFMIASVTKRGKQRGHFLMAGAQCRQQISWQQGKKAAGTSLSQQILQISISVRPKNSSLFLSLFVSIVSGFTLGH